MQVETGAPGHAATVNRSNNDTALRAAAEELEASFLAEMLKASGFGKARESFGGGAGEEHFASFMIDAHAKALAETGGIGLAQSIYEALKETQNEQTTDE